MVFFREFNKLIKQYFAGFLGGVFLFSIFFQFRNNVFEIYIISEKIETFFLQVFKSKIARVTFVILRDV